MKTQTRLWIVAILALLALAGVVGLVRGTTQPAAPVVQATPSAEEAHIQQLRDILQKSDLSEEGRSSVQEKLEMAERLATQQAAGKQNRSAKQADKDPGPAASFLQLPEQPLAEGIFEGSQGLVRPSAADVSNVWQGERNGTVFQVFAGASVEESPRGLVIVVTLTSGSPTGERQFYITPENSARLRILEAQDDRLLLEDEQGKPIYFDLNSRIFHH